MDTRGKLAVLSLNIVAALGALFFAFPLFYIVIGSSFAPDQFFIFPPKITPGPNLIPNYIHTVANTRFLRSLINSLVFAGGTTLGVLIVATTAGYSFAMFRYPGRKPLFYLTLVGLAIPFQLIAIPLFDLLVTYGMINSYLGAILPALTHPVAVIFMKQNMEQALVEDLLNSARIDGASEFQIFIRIVLPLVRTGIAALAVLLFIRRMNVLFWPLIVFRSPEMEVATQFISGLRGIFRPTPWVEVMPAAFLATIPTLIVFLLLQKYFVKGLLSGAVKE
jgi:ABC-type glycerol-3-phosphate transport system permease component